MSLSPQHPRILFLVTQGDLGGAQQYVLMLARAFRSRATIGIATAPDAEKSSWLSTVIAQENNIAHLTIPHLCRAVRPYNDLRAVFALRKLLQNDTWDILHANSSKAGVLASIAAWSLGKHRTTRVVYTAHGWVFLEPLHAVQKYLYLFLERFAAKGRDETIVLSEKERAVAQDVLHIPAQTTHLIPHDIAPDTTPALSREDARQALSLPNDNTFTIGVIANMYRTKGLDVLLAACEQPALRDLTWRLVIIGDGPERSALENQRARMAKKDAVRFVGQRPAAHKLLSACDLFVLPSRKEGSPFAILEALAAGLPIVATDVGGVRDTVGSAGTIVPPENPEALAVAIAYLLQHPEERRRLRDIASTTTAERRTQQKNMFEKTWDVYEHLLQR